MSFITSEVQKTFCYLSLLAGQYLPASSEDNEERRGQNEEPLQLPGRITLLRTSPKLRVGTVQGVLKPEETDPTKFRIKKSMNIFLLVEFRGLNQT